LYTYIPIFFVVVDVVFPTDRIAAAHAADCAKVRPIHITQMLAGGDGTLTIGAGELAEGADVDLSPLTTLTTRVLLETENGGKDLYCTDMEG